jgi:hypothetical protein
MILLIDYAQKLIYNNNSKITILDVKGHAKNFVIQSAVTSLEQIHPNNLAIVTDKVVGLPSGETRLNAH